MKNIFAHLGRGNKTAVTPTARTTPSKQNKGAKAAEGEDDPEKTDDTAEGEDDPEKTDDAAEGEGDPEKKDDVAEGEDDLEEEDEDEVDPEKEKEAAFRKGIIEGRRRERERCAAIFSSEHAAGREGMAATLAFTTKLPAKQAVAAMAATAVGKSNSFADAMSKQINPKIGDGGGGTPERGTAGKSLINAVNRRHAKK